MTADKAATSSVAEGVVVWFRPEMGAGVLRLRNGRQYRFTELDGLDMVRTGQVVTAVIVEGQPAQVTVRPLPDGVPRFEEPEPPPPPKKRASSAAKPRARKNANVSPKAKPVPTKRKISGAAVKLRPRRDGSLPEGLPVLHPQHGQGFVIVSSAKVARVRFMPHEEERSVRVGDLAVLDDV